MLKALSGLVILLAASMAVSAQPTGASFDAVSKVFRMDGGRVSYVFGVNEKDELQQLYWGGRLGTADSFPRARTIPEWASFDSSNTTTPQEYAGWGAGLFVEPALKVSFADGNRDLVLHYESHTVTPHGFDVVLKEIGRKIYVTLHYEMDPESGILARSATIENREAQPVTVEQAARRRWCTAGRRLYAELSHRALGRGVEPDPGRGASRSAGNREPERFDESPGQSMVCTSGRQDGRGPWRGLVWRVGMEWVLENHGREGPAERGACHRRLQSL